MLRSNTALWLGFLLLLGYAQSAKYLTVRGVARDDNLRALLLKFL